MTTYYTTYEEYIEYDRDYRMYEDRIEYLMEKYDIKYYSIDRDDIEYDPVEYWESGV